MKTTEPNNALQTTTMAVTLAASHPSRQPRSRLTSNVSQSVQNLGPILGKEFESKLTGSSYGVFRQCAPHLPDGFSVAKFGAPIVEDDSGNLITLTSNESIAFWDHETDGLTVIASSWEEFASGCIPPKKVKLEPGKVKSAWIDPEFAKRMGIPAPKDGWIRKKG